MRNTIRKHYSEEFKKEAIRRVIEGRSSSSKVSKELGLSQPTLSKWVRKYKEKGSAVFNQEGAEMKKLQAENRRLKAERDILKKAVTFFAKHDG